MSAPGRSSHPRSMIAVVVMAIAFESAVCQSLAWSEIPAIASRQRAEKKTFTTIQIADGFFKTPFGAEYHLAGRVDRIRKYGGPVRVFAEGNGGERFFFSSRRRHTSYIGDWSSDVCSSD